jgi:two-component system LytT family response regulator
MYIKTGGKLVKIFFRDILLTGSMCDYMKIVTTKENFVTHLTMKSFVALPSPQEFLQVRRSFMINTTFITAISKKEIELGTYKIPVGSNFKDRIDRLIHSDGHDVR